MSSRRAARPQILAILLLGFAAGCRSAAPETGETGPEDGDRRAEIRALVQSIRPGRAEVLIVRSRDRVAMVPIHYANAIYGNPDGHLSGVAISESYIGMLDADYVSHARFAEYLKETGADLPEGFEKTDAPYEATWREASAYAKWAGKVLPTQGVLADAARQSSALLPTGIRQWCISNSILGDTATLCTTSEEGLRFNYARFSRDANGSSLPRAWFRCWIDMESPAVSCLTEGPPGKGMLPIPDSPCTTSEPKVK